ETIVAKEAGDSGANFGLEAAMILHLRTTGVVPVPDVLHASSSLLLLEDMPGDHLTPEAEPDLGDTIARLHGVTCRKFGFDTDTLNGSFVLPNGWHDRWVPFFRDSRLIHAANAALAAGRLKPRDHHRIANLAGRLDELLTEPDMPALLHGDLWSANVLAVGPAVTALIDPSVVYGHPEAEIAYAVGMGGMGDAFVRAYTRHWPLDDGFWSTRRHVYLTYPAIMHIHYFGERYDPWLNSCLLAIGIE
ncbi:MAG TPA: fructosamine kinase family protein, partial [Thermomicrobiales bacterium]|nr:fructosamine kinase family protein [Thermomicrobiales bacterium]